MNVIAVIICGIVVLMLISMVISNIRVRKVLQSEGTQAEGVVFEVNYVSDIAVDTSTGSMGMYYPVIRFLTKENEWITRQYNIGRYPSAYREGDKVVVFYDPDDPTSFIIK